MCRHACVHSFVCAPEGDDADAVARQTPLCPSCSPTALQNPTLQDKVESRNADYAKIVRHLHFHNVPTDKPQQQQQYEASDVVVLGADPYPDPSSNSRRLGGGSPGISPRTTPRGGAAGDAGSGGGAAAAAAADEEWGAGMRDAELLVWVGDFNYRVDRPDGFLPDETDPENNPVNAQLFQYVHRKVS
jgi:hypothetical protein